MVSWVCIGCTSGVGVTGGETDAGDGVFFVVILGELGVNVKVVFSHFVQLGVEGTH